MMQDKQVADNVRQTTQGDPVADGKSRGWRWRTCNDAKGSGNDNDDDDKDQSLQW